MRSARLINSDASLNTFFEIGTLDFVPGTQTVLALRLFDSQKALRYVPPATSVLKIYLQKTDGTELEKTMLVIDADDRSMWSVTLTDTDTADLIGGNVRFELDPLGDASVIEIGLIKNGLSSIMVDC